MELNSLSTMKHKSRKCEFWLLCITKHRVKTKKLKESVSRTVLLIIHPVRMDHSDDLL